MGHDDVKMNTFDFDSLKIAVGIDMKLINKVFVVKRPSPT